MKTKEEKWFTEVEVGKLLGYSKKWAYSVRRVYKKHQKDFTPKDVRMDGLKYLFSKTGILKIAYRARTQKAVEMIRATEEYEISKRKTLLDLPYTVVEDISRMADAYFRLTDYMGVPRDKALVEFCAEVDKITGVSIANLVNLSRYAVSEKKDKYFLVTDIAKELGITPKQLNLFLEKQGLQVKDANREWHPLVEDGWKWTRFVSPFSQYTGQVLLWDKEYIIGLYAVTPPGAK